MAQAEKTLGKWAKRSLYGAGFAGLAGPSIVPFVPVFGGDFAALGIVTDIGPHAFRTGDFQSLNPVGGITFPEASSIQVLPSGGVDITWHNVYHPYNPVATFNMFAGETALTLLAIAAGLGIASGVASLRRKAS